MSWRIWVDNSPMPDWADYGLLESGSIQVLADRAAWGFPTKVVGRNPELIMEFLRVLEDRHGVKVSNHWTVTVMDSEYEKLVLEHPTWAELYEAFKVTA